MTLNYTIITTTKEKNIIPMIYSFQVLHILMWRKACGHWTWIRPYEEQGPREIQVSQFSSFLGILKIRARVLVFFVTTDVLCNIHVLIHST